MRKITISHLVFSSLFFILALFTILMLTLTSFVMDFKQMFRLTTQPFGVYFSVGLFLLIGGVATSFYHLVRIFSSALPKKYGVVIFFALCIFVLLLYGELFVLQRIHFDPFSLKDSLALEQNYIFTKTHYQMTLDYSFYIFFVVLPIVFYLFNLSFNKGKALGKILHLTQPSFNLVFGVLCGFSVMPFFKGGVFGYVDLVLFLLGLFVVLYLCVKRSGYLDSYEYFNLFLVLVISVLMMVAKYEFINSESYFEVRKAFYFLVLFGWCNAWMNKIKIIH